GPHSEPAPPEPPPAEPARATPPLQHRAPLSQAAPASAQPPTRARAESAPEQGKATAGAVTHRAAFPGESPSAPKRHAAPHTRPQTEASTRQRPPAVPEPDQPAREAQALEAIAEATSPALDLDASKATLPQRIAARFRLSREEPQVWGVGAVLGVLLLAGQVVNHYRDELAVTPRFGRPLTAFYASLGVQLVPRWDLHAYDVRQLGASTDPAGSGLITLRASVKNAGRQPQPLPLLRVTLQDRFGNRIAARDVAPRFYVPRTVPETSYLAGGQRIDAGLGFVEPGANAVGFEIDACLPASAGGIICANDLAAR